MTVRGRPRTTGANLPKNVHAVRRGGKTYYYYHPGRSGKSAIKAVPLGTDSESPEFWHAIRRLSNAERASVRTDTFSALIVAYKSSPEWTRLRKDTKKNYNTIINGLLRVFSDISVKDISRRDVMEMRDAMSETLSMANNAVSVLKTLLSWAMSRDWCDANVARDIPRLKAEEETGHIPWPEDVYAYVMSRAPEPLQRMAYLGRATGQRISDLVRICPEMLASDGIYTRISKRRDKRHFVPLLAGQMAEIRSWIRPESATDMPFLQNRIGKPASRDSISKHWHEWVRENPFMQGKAITIHGLKVTAVCDRFGRVTEGQIAKEIGMSVEMVQRYTRFIDAEAAARSSRDSREAAAAEKHSGVVKFKRRATT